MAGRFAGGVTAFLVLALLFQTTVDGKTVVHWRHIFWIFGGVGVVWCVFFWWWFRDRPEEKPGVNQAEIDLIQGGRDDSKAAAAVPWGTLLRSGNLWILCLMYFCAAYGWYFNITYLPGFLEKHYGVEKGELWTREFWEFGFMAGAPLLLGSLACLLGGVMSDFFIKRTGNRRWGRRLLGIIGHALCACCYLSAIFVNNAWLFVLAIGMAAFWNDMTMGPAWASCIDIGKRYSGIVAGCMNTVGNLGGVVAGVLTGWIVETFKNGADARPGWTVNFIIFAGVYAVATVLWCFFDSTRPVVPSEPVREPQVIPQSAGARLHTEGITEVRP
jgi:nitrate/nitrite transporter NarK